MAFGQLHSGQGTVVIALSKQPHRRSFSRSELKGPDQQMIRHMIPRQWDEWTMKGFDE
jgi:hypothetical protein